MWKLLYITYNLSNIPGHTDLENGYTVREKVKFTDGVNTLKIKIKVSVDIDYNLSIEEKDFNLILNGNFYIDDYAQILEILFNQTESMKASKPKKLIVDKQLIYYNIYDIEFDIWNHEKFHILFHKYISDASDMNFKKIDDFLEEECPEYNITKSRFKETMEGTLELIMGDIRIKRIKFIDAKGISPFYQIGMNDRGDCYLGCITTNKDEIDHVYKTVNVYKFYKEQKYFFRPELGFNLYMSHDVYLKIKETLKTFKFILDDSRSKSYILYY